MAVSAFAAFVAKYQSLSGALDLYTFDVPTRTTAGADIFPPYAAAIDDGTTPDYEFEHHVVETTEVRLMIYAPTLLAVDAAVEIAKYNGGSTTAALGLDFGTLPALTIPYSNLVVMRASEKRFAATATGDEAQRIHGCEMIYRITLYRS